jgi:hypothetical protein
VVVIPEDEDDELAAPDEGGDELAAPDEGGDELAVREEGAEELAPPDEGDDELAVPHEGDDELVAAEEYADAVLEAPVEEDDPLSAAAALVDELPTCDDGGAQVVASAVEDGPGSPLEAVVGWLAGLVVDVRSPDPPPPLAPSPKGGAVVQPINPRTRTKHENTRKRLFIGAPRKVSTVRVPSGARGRSLR